MENETCPELRTIEYKSKLLNPNSTKKDQYNKATKIGTLQNMEDFLEREKTFHTDTPWTKLNKNRIINLLFLMNLKKFKKRFLFN